MITPEKNALQTAVIEAALAACDNAAYLPDGVAQIPSELCEELGQSLFDLGDYEREEYADYLLPLEKPSFFGFTHRQGLNSAQVSLLRINMGKEQVRIERIIDAADSLYLAIFDEVVIPGAIYRTLSSKEAGEIQYIYQSEIKKFRSLL